MNPIVLTHGEIYGRLTELRKEGSRYLCGCGVCGHRQHFRAKALMRADGVRSCRRCQMAGAFKTANEGSGKPKGHTGNSRPDTELPRLTTIAGQHRRDAHG